MKKKLTLLTTAVATLAVAGTAAAAVSFDSATGTGFTDKSNVQTALSWNNSQLQKNANAVQFQYKTVEDHQINWVCRNAIGTLVEEFAFSTVTTTQAIADSAAAVHKQVTGFNLLGYSASPVSSTVTTGASLYFCPDGFTQQGQPQDTLVSSSANLQVSSGSSGWANLL